MSTQFNLRVMLSTFKLTLFGFVCTTWASDGARWRFFRCSCLSWRSTILAWIFSFLTNAMNDEGQCMITSSYDFDLFNERGYKTSRKCPSFPRLWFLEGYVPRQFQGFAEVGKFSFAQRDQIFVFSTKHDQICSQMLDMRLVHYRSISCDMEFLVE